jgi:hypothetical protein
MIRAEAVLARIKPGDRVLDVGGWASPFNRADWILDCKPYETRGFYGTVGLPASQGGETEYFNEKTWVVRDICEKTPWPFPDNFFDFSICAGTLEDIRDPLFVCSELIRVSRAGYVETPSRLAESCRGWEDLGIAGLSHHRWLVEYLPNELVFCSKYHIMHTSSKFSLPPSVYRGLTREERMDGMFWTNAFDFRELIHVGPDPVRQYLGEFVDRHRHRATEGEPGAYQELLANVSDVQSVPEASRLRLDPPESFGPMALAVARRLRKASLRYPVAASLVKPILQAGRAVLRPKRD